MSQTPTSNTQLSFTLVCLFCICLFGAACSRSPVPTDQPTTTAPKLIPITLQLDWYAQPEYGGFFQALTQGYYQEAGLDVKILNAAPGFPFFQSVAKGDAQFGTVRYDMLAQAVQQGLPLQAISYYMAHSPVAIMVKEESPIQTFEDLDQKSLMANPVVPFLDWLKQTYQLDLAVVPSKWEVATFMADQVDAQQCFITSEPYYLAQQGVKVRTLLIRETGFDPYRILYVNKKFAQANPETTRAFVTATIAGWKSYFSEDPSAANEIIRENNNKISPDFAQWARQTMLDSGVVFGKEDAPYSTYGYLAPQRLQTMVTILQKLKLLERDFNIHESYSLDYLPAQ